jgi:hypothetical protein
MQVIASEPDALCQAFTSAVVSRGGWRSAYVVTPTSVRKLMLMRDLSEGCSPRHRRRPRKSLQIKSRTKRQVAAPVTCVEDWAGVRP